MQARSTMIAAALIGGLGVALGAFGAHGLKGLVEPTMLSVWQTAVQYQLVHALALLALSAWLFIRPNAWLQRSAFLMVLGTVLFSGSLYVLVLTGVRPLGMITPIGGITWLVAWAYILLAARKLPTQSN